MRSIRLILPSNLITLRIRRMGEGNVFSLFTSGGGGYPYPIMLCNISQNTMGQPGGGYPARSRWGGVTLPGPAGGYPVGGGGYPGWGGTLAGGYPVGGYPGRGYPGWGVPCWGGYPARGGYPGRGGTQLGQHREYLLHGGQYASCVHAGGLSC